MPRRDHGTVLMLSTKRRTWRFRRRLRGAQSARTIAPGPDLDRYGAGTEHRRQPVQQAIVAGIAAIARQFDVRLLAEWMKTGAELTVLRAAGNLFQGYYFALPALMALPAAPGISMPVQITAGA
jgi:hypothetical protein